MTNYENEPLSVLLGEEDLETIRSMRFVDTKAIFQLGIACGWRWTLSQAFHMISHDGVKVDVPSNTGLNAKVFRSRVNTIIRHRSPGTNLISAVESVIASPLMKLGPDRTRVLREAAASAPPVEPAPTIQVQEPEPVPAKVKATRKVRIVKEEPWNAHRNAKGETYPSDAVMERTWSNGTVDYRCRWEPTPGDRCEYTDENPYSVRSHNAAHKRGQGHAVVPPVDGIDPTWVSNPRRATRIRNLTREIDGAFTAAAAQSVELDPAWLAEWIIDHRIDALPSSGDSEVPAQLSAEEILDKIASLVDRGRGKVLREQVDSLQQQIDRFQEQIETFTAERDILTNTFQQQVDDANARATQAENDWAALRDIIVNRPPQP